MDKMSNILTSDVITLALFIARLFADCKAKLSYFPA